MLRFETSTGGTDLCPVSHRYFSNQCWSYDFYICRGIARRRIIRFRLQKQSLRK
jgi:hypothetical protein